MIDDTVRPEGKNRPEQAAIQGENMKNYRFAILAILAALLVIMTVACNGDPFGKNEPVSISLSKNLIEYDSFSSIGDAVIELSATVKLKSGETSSDVKWVLPDDISYYTLLTNSNGRLTFKINKPGYWTIEADAYYKDKIVKTAFCVVNVKGYVTSLNIQNASTRTTFASGSPVSMYTGATMVLAPVYNPLNTSQTAVTWSVSNDCVVLTPDTASQQATITAARAGKVTVTMASADNPSVSATLNVTVNESGAGQTTAPVSISLTPSGTNTLGIGRETTVIASVLDGFGHEDNEAEIVWTSGDQKVLAVSPTGNRTARVSALKTGVTTLTATLKNNGDILSRTYFDVTGGIAAISPASQAYNLAVGEVEDIEVSYAPADTTQTGFTAVSSNTRVATVSVSSSNMMKITAVSEGTAEIILTSTKNTNVKSDPIYITVITPASDADRVKSVDLSAKSLQIDPPYEAATVGAVVMMRNLEGKVSADENEAVTWTASDPKVVSIRTIGNLVEITAVAPGTCTVTAASVTNPAIKSSILVTVGGKLTSLLPNTEQLSLSVGTTDSFTVTPNPANAVFNEPQLTVTAPSVISARMTKLSSGNYNVDVTALSTGTSEIKVSVDGTEHFTVPVTVSQGKSITVFALELSDYNLSLAQDGESRIVSAKLLDIDGNEVPGTIEWTADAQASRVVDMVKSGSSLIISPKNAGVANILITTPENELLSARLRIEVGGSAVQGTNLRSLMTPVSSISIPMGQSEEVNIVYIPADTKQTGLVWKIADASIATISGDDSRVVITPKKVGKTTVTATSSVNEKISTSFEVNVTEDAGATDTSISYIKVFSGDREVTYMSHTKLNEVATLTAKAYTADGRQVDGGIVFTVSGDAIVQYAGGSGSVSYRTAAFGGNQPAYITAAAEDNPDASAQVSVYVTPTTSPVTGRIDTAYSAVTILTDGSMEIPLERQSCTDVISWSANDSCISWAENESGNIVVTGLSAGQATLTGRYQTGIISIKVLVVDEVKTIDNSVVRIELDRSYLSYDLNSKAAQVITASVVRADGSADSNEKVVWSVEDEEVATVMAAGLKATVAHGLTIGLTRIKAVSVSNPAVEAYCVVEVVDSSVIPETIRNITLNSTSVTMEPGNQKKLTYTIAPSAFQDSQIRWTTDNASVATVDGGTVRAIGAGTATITAKVVGTEIQDTCTVNVISREIAQPDAYRIEFNTNVMYLSQDDMDIYSEIIAAVYDTAGNKMVADVDWEVNGNEEGIIRFTESHNRLLVTPLSAGTVSVTAKHGNVTNSMLVVVGAPGQAAGKLSSIVAQPSRLVVRAGSTASITAYGVPGGTLDDAVWSISDETVAGLSADGNTAAITGLAAGSATVTVTSESNPTIKTSVQVTVQKSTAGKITSIELDKRQLSFDLASKSLTEINAKVYVDGSLNTTTPITWTVEGWTGEEEETPVLAPTSSSNRNVLVNYSGKGTGYIKAASSDGDVYALCLISVIDSSDISLKALELSPSAIQIRVGESAQVRLEDFPRGTSENAEWAIENPDIAEMTIASDGKSVTIRGLVAGETSLRVTDGEISSENVIVNVYEPKETGVITKVALDNAAVMLDLAKPELPTVTASVYIDGVIDPSATVTFSLVDPEGAPISFTQNGNTAVLTKLAEGECVLRATAEGETSRGIGQSVWSDCLVYVINSMDSSLKAIELNPSAVQIKVGEYVRIKLTDLPDGTVQDPEWIVNNPDIASILVSQDGRSAIIRGLAEGLTVLSVTDGDISSETAFIRVYEEEETGIISKVVLDKSAVLLDLAAEEFSTVEASVYIDGVLDPTADVTFSLVDPEGSPISFVQSGNTAVLTKISEGEAVLRATATGTTTKGVEQTVWSDCLVYVTNSTDNTLRALEITPASTQLKVGESVQIKLTDVPYGRSQDPQWVLDDPETAEMTVASNGRSVLIRALAAGETFLTVSDGTISSENAVIRVYEEEESGIINKVVLDKATMTLDLAKNEVGTVSASVYVDGEIDPAANVTFSLVDPEGAPISFVQSDNTAVVSKLAKGEAVLRATATGSTSKSVAQTVWSDCYVNIIDSSEVSLTSIALNPSSVQIMVGETAQMSLEDLPRGLSQNPEWSVEDTDLVSITTSEDGRSVIIRGLAAGETFIKVTDGEISSDNAFIKVLENAETGIINKVVLNKSAIMLDMAKEELSTVTATVYIDGIMDPAAEVTFSLVDPEGAPVGFLQNGNTAILSKLETGEAVLRATITGSTSKGIEQTLWSDCYVYVIDSTSPAENPTYTELASIVLSQRNLLLTRGESYLLTASIVPENARDVELEWSSDNPEIATVSTDGLVTGRAAGQTIIRVSDVNTGIGTSCSVTVSGNAVKGVAQIQLVPYSVNLQQDDDEPKTITARVLDEDGNELSAMVTWDVEPILRIADVTIDGNTLSLLPLNAGSGYVKASCGGYSARALVTTGEEKTAVSGGDLSRITVTPASVALVAGDSQLLTAAAYPAGKADNITWAADNPSAVSVVPTGDSMSVYVTGQNVGSKTKTLVTASQAGVTGKTEVTVYPEGTTGIISRIDLDRTSMVLDLDAKAFAFVNARVYVDGQYDASKTVTWTIVDANGSVIEDPIATLSVSGNRAGIQKESETGEFFLRATATGELNSVFSDCHVEIVKSSLIATELSSIILSESDITIAPGVSRRLTATSVPSSYPLSLAWTSDKPEVASVSGNGTVTANTEGTAVITATDVSGVSASCTVRVSQVSASTIARSIVLTPYTVTLSQEDEARTETIVANVIGSDNLPMATTVSWNLDGVLDIVRAEVDGNSVTLAPLNSGSGNITAKYGNLTATAHVIVGSEQYITADGLKSYTLSPASLQIRVGESELIEARDYPAGTGRNPEWLVDEDEVAAINRTSDSKASYIEGVAEGSTFVYVREGDITSPNAAVTVYGRDVTGIINKVQLDKSLITLDMAEKALTTVTATVWVDGKATAAPVTFSIVGEGEAPVSIIQNGNTAIINKLAVGECRVRATATGTTSTGAEQIVSSDCYVNVIDSSTLPKTVNRLILSETMFSLYPGESRTISWTAIPAVEGTEVTFASSDDSIAEVTNTGIVRAMAAGNAVITASVVGSDISATATLTVRQAGSNISPQVINAARVELDTNTVLVSMEDPLLCSTINATVYDGNGDVVDTQVSWDVSELKGIATVSVSGNQARIYPVNAGKGTISATATNANGTFVSSSAVVIVGSVNGSLTGISFDVSQPMYMVLGDTKEVGIIYNPDMPEVHGVTWGDSAYFEMKKYKDSAMLTATELTGNEGTKITATSNFDPEKKAELKVITKATAAEIPQAASIELSTNSITYNLAAKDLNIVTATVRDYYGNVVDIPVEWTLTGDSNVARMTVLSNGKAGIAMGTRTGSAMLTATCGEVSAKCQITTVDYSEIQSVAVNTRNIILNINEHFDLSFSVLATGEYDLQDLDSVSWVSNDYSQNVIELSTTGSPFTRTVTATGAGTATVTLRVTKGSQEFTDQCVITVLARPTAELSSLMITPSTGDVEEGGSRSFAARGFDGDGNEMKNLVVTWIADNTEIARITETHTGTGELAGLSVAEVLGVKAGTTKIYAKAGSLTAEASVNVTSAGQPAEPDKLLSINAAQTSFTMSKGEVRNVAVMPNPSTYRMAGISVTSSDENIVAATYNQSYDESRNIHYIGLNAKDTGTATVRVWNEGKSTDITVTVTEATAESEIRLSAYDVTLQQTAGYNETQIQATVFNTKGNPMNAQVTWDVVGDCLTNTRTKGNTITVRAVSVGNGHVVASYTGANGPIFAVANIHVNSSGVTVEEPKTLQLSASRIYLTCDDGSDEAVVKAIWAPSNLRADLRNLVWTVKVNGAESTDVVNVYPADSTGETAVIRAMGTGVAQITVSSESFPDIKAEMTVEVLGENEDAVQLSIDTKTFRLNPGEHGSVWADLKINGEASDASGVHWEIVSGDGVTSAADTGEVYAFTAGQTAGITVVEASYQHQGKTARARFVIEVTDLRADGAHLRSVSFGTENIDINLQGAASKTATLQLVPNTISDLSFSYSVEQDYEVISIDGSTTQTVTITGLKEGTATVVAEVSEKNGTPITARLRVNVSGPQQSTSYGSLKLSSPNLTISAYETASMIGATVTDNAGNDITDSVSSLIRWYTTDLDGGNVNTSPSDAGSMVIRTAYNTSATNMVSAVRPGYKYLWAVLLDDPDADLVTGSGVRAKALVTVKGEVTAVSLDSQYLSIKAGDNVTVTASTSPSDAYFDRGYDAYSRWELEFDNGDGVRTYKLSPANNMYLKGDDLMNEVPGLKVRLARPSASQVTVTASEEVAGTVKLRYLYPEKNLATEASISVSAVDKSGSNIRRVYFDELFPVIAYNATNIPVRAHIELMDGTEPSSGKYQVRYLVARYLGLDAPDHGTKTETILNVDAGVDSTFHIAAINGQAIYDENLPTDQENYYGDTNVFVEKVPGHEEFLGPAYTTYEDGYIYLNASGKTDEKIVLMAVVLSPDSNEIIAYGKSYLSIQDYTGSVTLSNDAISVFAGGSTVIEAYAESGASVQWTVGTIRDAAGHVVSNTNLKTGHTKPMLVGLQGQTEGPENMSETKSGSKISVYTPFEISGNPVWPYTVNLTAKATGSNGDVSYRTMVVKISALPEGNTYASSITFDQSKLNLTPPFKTEQTITATVKDGDGNELPAEQVEWAWYPVSSGTTDAFSETSGYALDTGNVYTDSGAAQHGYVNGYFSADTHSFYYIPKSSGVYRLQARVSTNPALVATATVNISGSPTGISVDNSFVNISRGGTQTVGAVLSPAGALVTKENVFWFIQDTDANGRLLYTTAPFDEKGGTDRHTWYAEGTSATADADGSANPYFKEIGSGVRASNAFIRVTNNGFSIQLYGIKETDTPVAFRVVYTDGNVSYSYDFDASVVLTKAIHTVSATGSTQVDPSNVEGSQLTYTLSATNSDGSQFEKWDWLDVMLYGKETGAVYASSAPVTQTLEQSHELFSGGSQQTYDAMTELSDQAIAALPENQPAFASGAYYYNTASPLSTGSGGRLTLVDNTFSFSLDKSGYPLEPLVLVVKLADGSTSQAAIGDEYASYRNGKVSYSAANQVAVPDLSTAADNSGREGWVRSGSALANGYDPQGDVLNAKKLEVAIGGKIQGLSIKEIQVMSNGNKIDSTLTGINSVKLAEGAAATAVLNFSPTYTHQKGIYWNIYKFNEDGTKTKLHVVPGTQTDDEPLEPSQRWEGFGTYVDSWKSLTGDDVSRASFVVGPEGDTITVSAGKLQGSDTTYTYILEAVSKTDLSVRTTMTVTISCQIKSIDFTAHAAYDINKNRKALSAPEYIMYGDENKFPSPKGTDVIYCYDTTDATSSQGNVIDAYYVDMDVIPNYGYKLNCRVISGKEIGEVSRYNIDEDVNAFYFIPKGRLYEFYDESGNGYGPFTVNYGEVVVELYNEEVNYSKQFSLYYQQSNKRIVGIQSPNSSPTDPDPQGDWQWMMQKKAGSQSYNWMDIWDYSKQTDGATSILGLQQVILYQDEPVQLTIADIDAESGMPYLPYAESLRWSVYTSRGVQNQAIAGHVTDPSTGEDHVLNTDSSGTVSFQEFEIPGAQQLDSGELRDTHPTVVRLSFGAQGVYYLSYTLKQYTSGEETVWDEHTGTETVATGTVTGVIPIYVVSKASPLTSVAIQGSGTRMIIGKNHVGKMQKNHWYGYDTEGNRLPTAVAMDYKGVPESVYDVNGNEIEASMLEGGAPYRGTAYLIFDSTQLHENLRSDDPMGKLRAAIGTSQSFNFIDSYQANKLVIDSSTNEALARYSVEQGGVALYKPTIADITLTGESGVDAFPNVEEVRIDGSGSFTVNTDGGPLQTLERMFQNNSLDFSDSSVATYEFKNIPCGTFNKNISANPSKATKITVSNCSEWASAIANLNSLTKLTELSLDSDAVTSFSLNPTAGMALTTLNIKNNPGSATVTSNGRLESLTSADLSGNTGDISLSGGFANLATLKVAGSMGSVTVSGAPKLASLNAGSAGASGKTLSLTSVGTSSSGTAVDARNSLYPTVGIMASKIAAFDGTSSKAVTFTMGDGTAANSSYLGSLNLSGVTTLTGATLHVNNSGANCNVDLSGCTSLTTLNGSGKLNDLNLKNTGIGTDDGGSLKVYGTLTVSYCPNLVDITRSCAFHGLMEMATAFSCNEEHSIQSIDFSGCSRYTSIVINDNAGTKNLRKVFIPNMPNLAKLSLQNGYLGEGGADTTGPSQFTIVTTYDHYKTYYMCEEDYNNYMGYGVSSLIEVGTKINEVGTVVEVTTEKVECTETYHFEPGTWGYNKYGPEATLPKNSPYCGGHSDSDDDTYYCHSHYVITVRGQTTSVSSALDGVTDFTTMWENPKMEYGLIFNGSLICSGWLRSSDAGMQKLAEMAASNGENVNLSGNGFRTKTYTVTPYQVYEGGLFSLRQWNGTSETVSTDTYFITAGNDGYNSSVENWESDTGHTHNAGHRTSNSLQKSGKTFYYNLTETIDSSKKACGGCDGGHATGNLYFYPFGR